MTRSADLNDLAVSSGQPLREVLRQIDRNGRGIALVVEDDGTLSNTVTDGDLRRAILAGLELGSPVSTLQRQEPPVVAPVGTPRRDLVRLMQERHVRHIPLVDAKGRVRDLIVSDDLLRLEQELPSTAVVMAGGRGVRMLPLTADTPKPLLRVGDKPLVERTLNQLRAAGIQKVYMATHYKAEAFSEYFGTGVGHGLSIQYVKEQQPLGTAGALSKMKRERGPFLVVNGDIVTDLNYRSMMLFHSESAADLTVGVRQYEFRVPYGVVTLEETHVRNIVEKPKQNVFVNAGIYVVAPKICELVPANHCFDMPELIRSAIFAQKNVVAFPISEYWIDIGEPHSYKQAQRDSQENWTA